VLVPVGEYRMWAVRAAARGSGGWAAAGGGGEGGRGGGGVEVVEGVTEGTVVVPRRKQRKRKRKVVHLQFYHRLQREETYINKNAFFNFFNFYLQHIHTSFIYLLHVLYIHIPPMVPGYILHVMYYSLQ